MAFDINFLTGIQDPGLQMDKEGTGTITDKIKIIHLVKTGKCRCPICSRPMLKKGFRSLLHNFRKFSRLYANTKKKSSGVLNTS